MRIEFSSRVIEGALLRIAKSLESIDLTMSKITTEDFTQEDEAVKAAAAEVEAAKQRIPH